MAATMTPIAIIIAPGDTVRRCLENPATKTYNSMAIAVAITTMSTKLTNTSTPVTCGSPLFGCRTQIAPPLSEAAIDAV